MSQKAFIHDLRRGLGSAIVEMQKNPNQEQYCNIVLRCCLRDIGYDTQVEGTKGYYLYTAICALGEKDIFENLLIEAYQKRLSHRLFQQISDILRQYVFDGSDRATQAVKNKYEHLKNQLMIQRTFPQRYCEREQFEELMINQVDFNGWLAFQQCVNDAGEIMLARKDDLCSYYDWFISHSENIFGKKRIWRYFDSQYYKSAVVRAFIDGFKDIENSQAEYQITYAEAEISLEELIDKTNEIASDEYAYARIYKHVRQFIKNASTEEFVSLAKYALNEPSDAVKACLLRAFKRVDFPMDIEALLPLAFSENEILQSVSVDALERFKDPRVHDLAIQLIDIGNIESGLALLRKNWRRQDEPLIRNTVLKSRHVTHAMQMELCDIYNGHRSKTCGDILMHIYKNGECTFCRYGVVEAMLKNQVLPEHILYECQFDSYDDTRRLAEKTLQKRKALKG